MSLNATAPSKGSISCWDISLWAKVVDGPSGWHCFPSSNAACMDKNSWLCNWINWRLMIDLSYMKVTGRPNHNFPLYISHYLLIRSLCDQRVLVFKLHIVEVIADLGPQVELRSLSRLFSLEIFWQVFTKMTSIWGCRMHLLDLSLRRSPGFLRCRFTDAVSDTSGVSVRSTTEACFAAYCSRARSHTEFTSTVQMWEGKNNQKRSIPVEQGLGGPTVLTIQYFQRSHIAGIIPVRYWYYRNIFGYSPGRHKH